LTSLVLPTYNPGAGAAITWQRLREFLDRAPGAWEILFVCDGCTDGSVERLEEWTRPYRDQVRVLSHQPNRGKGYAVWQGLAAAKGRWRLFTDFDLAYGVDDILRLAQLLHEGAEVAVGSRLHPESQCVVSAGMHSYAYLRYLQSVVFARLAR